MSGVVVLDAGVLVALWDPDDPGHRAAVAAVRALRDAHARWAVPATVLAQVMVGAARTGDKRLRTRMAQFRAAFGTALPVDEKTAEVVARLQATRPQLDASDAYLLGTAQRAQATH